MTRWAVVITAMLGAMLGLGAFTFHYGEGLSYFSADPRACKNCHIMNDEYASWTKGVHHATARRIDCLSFARSRSLSRNRPAGVARG